MTPEAGIQTVQKELEASIILSKCRKCGCMESALQNFSAVLPGMQNGNAALLSATVSAFQKAMQPVQYSCLGCDYCYPAVAQNAFAEAFPTITMDVDLSCDFRVNDVAWPPVAGEYVVVDRTAPVAVSTLASLQLAEQLANDRPAGLALVGKTETENIGIDKIIKNVVTSPTLRYLIVAGQDSRGHYAGKTLLALAENGVDARGRVIGPPGKRPVLRNVTLPEIEAFREQVEVIDMIGCEDVAEISARIEGFARQAPAPCGCNSCCDTAPAVVSSPPRIIATEAGTGVPMDKAGYFVIIPLKEQGKINVEHYAYDNSLLRMIDGSTARALYKTIIGNGWVTELSHAAYLGKELARAELALQHGFTYIQDGA
jgi:tetrahydromethanopterin S-methyltransferase subunit A